MIAFPNFRVKTSHHGSARLEHRALDGATVDGLPFQARGLRVEERAIALITIGGNDLLRGLIRDTGAGIATFANTLDTFSNSCPSCSAGQCVRSHVGR